MKWIAFAFIPLLALSCKDDDSDRNDANENFISAANASQGTSSGLDEAMDLLADTDQEDNGTALALTAERTVTRTCTPDGTSAKVDIDATFTGQSERVGRLATWSQTFTNRADLTRVWSKDGSTIACTLNGKYAALGALGDDLSGLKLDVTFKRESGRTATTTLKNGIAKNTAVSASSEGTRSVLWTNHTVNNDGTVTRSKTIGTEGVRNVDDTHSGVSTQSSYKVVSSPEAPLEVDVTFESVNSQVVKSRLIKAGVLVATTVGAGRFESTFDNLLVEVTSTSCEPKSGKVTTKLYKEGNETPSFIYEAVAVDGTYEVNDVTDPANPVAITDFDYQLCDVRAFSN